jgi:hypothetical protein
MGERSKRRKHAKKRANLKRRRARARRRPEQLGLVHAYKGRGGPRPGAGRKPAPGRRRSVPHRRRAVVRRDRPLHVTLRQIATPKQARAVLLYVVGNFRKHAARAGRILHPRWVDPFSSARQLDGWNQPVRLEPGVVASPKTWMLRTGWRRHGLLDAHAIPSRAR